MDTDYPLYDSQGNETNISERFRLAVCKQITSLFFETVMLPSSYNNMMDYKDDRAATSGRSSPTGPYPPGAKKARNLPTLPTPSTQPGKTLTINVQHLLTLVRLQEVFLWRVVWR